MLIGRIQAEVFDWNPFVLGPTIKNLIRLLLYMTNNNSNLENYRQLHRIEQFGVTNRWNLYTFHHCCITTNPKVFHNTSNVPTFKFIEIDAKESFDVASLTPSMDRLWLIIGIIARLSDGGEGKSTETETQAQKQSKINSICDGLAAAQNWIRV